MSVPTTPEGIKELIQRHGRLSTWQRILIDGKYWRKIVIEITAGEGKDEKLYSHSGFVQDNDRDIDNFLIDLAPTLMEEFERLGISAGD